jgi:hypothetical protein
MREFEVRGTIIQLLRQNLLISFMVRSRVFHGEEQYFFYLTMVELCSRWVLLPHPGFFGLERFVLHRHDQAIHIHGAGRLTINLQ